MRYTAPPRDILPGPPDILIAAQDILPTPIAAPSRNIFVALSRDISAAPPKELLTAPYYNLLSARDILAARNILTVPAAEAAPSQDIFVAHPQDILPAPPHLTPTILAGPQH